MIPEIGETNIVQQVKQPSKTYKIDFDAGRIHGFITDPLQAIQQAIYKILMTERYAYVIYDWFYGAGLMQYIGETLEYIQADIKRNLETALLYDDRIVSVDSVTVERGTKVDACIINFSVTTTEGILSDKTEVILRK